MPAIVPARFSPAQTRSRAAMLGVIATIGVLQALAILVHLVRAKLAAVLLGPEGVGVLGVIDPLVQLVAHLSSFSLPLAAVKFLSSAHSEGPSAFGDASSSFLKAVVALSAAGTALAVSLVALDPAVLGTRLAGHRALVLVGLLGVPLLPLKDLVANVLAAARAARTSASLALIMAAAGTVASTAGALLAGVLGFLGSGLLGSALALAGALVHVRRRFRLRLSGATRTLTTLARQNPDIVLFSLVLYLAYSSYPLTHFVSRYVVLARFGEAEAGLLQAAMDLSGALALVLGPSTALYLAPIVNRRIGAAEKAQAATDFLRDLTLIGATLAMPLVLFPRWGLLLLFSPAFARVGPVVFLFVVAQCLRLLAGVFQTLLIGLDDIAVYGALVGAGQLSFGALAWLWGRTHGVAGVALAFLLSNLLILLLTAARARQRHGVSLPWRLRGLIGYGLLALLLAGGVARGLDDREVWALAVRLCACVAFALSLLALAERGGFPRVFRTAEE